MSLGTASSDTAVSLNERVVCGLLAVLEGCKAFGGMIASSVEGWRRGTREVGFFGRGLLPQTLSICDGCVPPEIDFIGGTSQVKLDFEDFAERCEEGEPKVSGFELLVEVDIDREATDVCVAC